MIEQHDRTAQEAVKQIASWAALEGVCKCAKACKLSCVEQSCLRVGHRLLNAIILVSHGANAHASGATVRRPYFRQYALKT